MSKFNLILSVVLFACGIQAIFAQSVSNASALRAGEKAYLHLDNSAYFLGDTIRMAAYVLDANTKQLTHKSKVLYVDMVAPEGYVVLHKTYPLVDGRCEGDFTLSPLLLSGLYEIRAYTHYMLSGDARNCFSMVVPVYDLVKNGQYSSLKMRKRSLRKHQRESGKMKAAKNDDAQNNGERSRDEVSKVTCFYDASALQPYSVVTLKLKGQPGSSMSLSVMDYDNYIKTPSKGIADVMASDVLVASDAHADEPEQGITIYGKAGILNMDNGTSRFKSLPQQLLDFHLLTQGKDSTFHGTTDALGKYSLCLGDFMGDAGLQLKFKHLSDSSLYTKYIVDNQITPLLRDYTKDEQRLQTSVLMGGRKLSVTHQNMPKSYFSAMHLDLIKEIDKLINEDENSKTAAMPSLAVGCSLLAEKYSHKKMKMVVTLALSEEIEENKHVLKATTVNNLTSIKNFSGMIIRSDHNIRKDNASPTQLRDNYMRSGNYPYLLPPTETGNIFFGADRIDLSACYSTKIIYPSAVCCLIPDTSHEWEKYIKYNQVPQSRYLKISGYSSLLPYRLPNYSKSYPKSDFRRTLYWNPNVQLDEKGEATIQFYNNGTCKRLIVSGEGVSKDGKAIVCQCE